MKNQPKFKFYKNTNNIYVQDRVKEANFTPKTKEKARILANNKCSNPFCKQCTIQSKYIVPNRGEAAHITAASPTGPRYNSELTNEQRKSLDNCIHLCHNCHKLVDKHSNLFPPELLQIWKTYPNSEDTDSEVSRTKLFLEGGRCNSIILEKLN